MVLLVVLDHAMHAYSPHFKQFWYIPDFGGSLFFDLWHMHNDIIMMPLLFFLAGLFVLPSLKRRGLLDFSREKLIRLGIPFVVGVATLVPLQTYPKYLLFKDAYMSYGDYLKDVYFFDNMSASGFWFLYYLFVLTIALLLINALVPAVLRCFKNLAHFMMTKPIAGFTILCLIVAIILGTSDLIWGAPWWIGFGKLFYLRGSRFIVKAFLFFLGAGFAQAGAFNNAASFGAITKHWKLWLGLALVAGMAYMSYALLYFYEPVGPYNTEIKRHFYLGGTWSDVWPVFERYAPAVLLRTSLMAVFMISLILAYLSVFKRFLDQPLPMWMSLAACSYGIYIIHEPMVVWTHYCFYQSDVSELIKFALAGFGSLVISWAIIAKLRPLPGFRKVL
jgi:Acyltransferase family.